MKITTLIDAAAVRFAKRAAEVRKYQRTDDPVTDVAAELDADGTLSIFASIRGHDFGVEVQGFPSASWDRYTRRWLVQRFTAAANHSPAIAAPVVTDSPATIPNDPIDGIVGTLTDALADLDRRLTALEGRAQT